MDEVKAAGLVGAIAGVTGSAGAVSAANGNLV